MESQEEQTGGTFVGAGGIELFFRSWPAPAPRGVVVLSHGLGEHSGRYHHVGRRLADAGYSTWALDHRGHGRSGGRRAFVETFSSFVADLETFRLRVAAASGGLPTFLVGHSMGGTIATAHALDHPGAFAGLVLSAPAWHPGRDVPRPVVAVGRALARIRPTLGLVAIDAAQVSRDPAVVAAYRSDPLVHQGRITARLGAELRTRALGFPPQLAGLTIPVLVQHGTADELVPVIGSRELFGTIGSADKTLKEYGGLRHEIYNEPERGGVLDDLVAWLHDHTGAP